MSQSPTPGGGPNQTLIELILALKGLAQTFDLAIDNLRTLIESESKVTSRELDRVRDLVAKSNQAVAILPITISDRVEKLVKDLEDELGDKIDERIEGAVREITVAVAQVQEKFVLYVQAKGEAVPEELMEGPQQVTGRLSLRRDGTVDVRLQTAWIKHVITAGRWMAVGGAGFGIVELLRMLFGF